MNEPTISEELLLKAGYTERQVNSIKLSDRVFQKLIRDEQGKKYYITVYVSDFGKVRSDMGKHFEFEVQLDLGQGAVRFTTIQWFNNSGRYSGNTIEGVEQYFEWLWDAHNKPYYEPD